MSGQLDSNHTGTGEGFEVAFLNGEMRTVSREELNKIIKANPAGSYSFYPVNIPDPYATAREAYSPSSSAAQVQQEVKVGQASPVKPAAKVHVEQAAPAIEYGEAYIQKHDGSIIRTYLDGDFGGKALADIPSLKPHLDGAKGVTIVAHTPNPPQKALHTEAAPTTSVKYNIHTRSQLDAPFVEATHGTGQTIGRALPIPNIAVVEEPPVIVSPQPHGPGVPAAELGLKERWNKLHSTEKAGLALGGLMAAVCFYGAVQSLSQAYAADPYDPEQKKRLNWSALTWGGLNALMGGLVAYLGYHNLHQPGGMLSR